MADDRQKTLTLLAADGYTWRIDLDRDEVNANDPGEGTPAMVVRVDDRGNEETATYWFAIQMGILSSNDDEIPDRVMTWLQKYEGEVNTYLYPDD